MVIKQNREVYLTMEDPKSTVKIAYKKEFLFAKETVLYTRALGDILQLRINESVREKEGGAYSLRANASFSREPKPMVYVSFSFDCNPDLVEKLVTIVNGELQNIAEGNIIDEDLNKIKIKTNFIKERAQSKDKNAYDMELPSTYFRYDENIDDPKTFVEIVNNMTKANIQGIVEQVLDDGQSYEVIFKPKTIN